MTASRTRPKIANFIVLSGVITITGLGHVHILVANSNLDLMKRAVAKDLAGSETDAVGGAQFLADPFVELPNVLQGLGEIKSSIGTLCNDFHTLAPCRTLQKVELIFRQSRIEILVRVDSDEVDQGSALR